MASVRRQLPERLRRRAVHLVIIAGHVLHLDLHNRARGPDFKNTNLRGTDRLIVRQLQSSETPNASSEAQALDSLLHVKTLGIPGGLRRCPATSLGIELLAEALLAHCMRKFAGSTRTVTSPLAAPESGYDEVWFRCWLPSQCHSRSPKRRKDSAMTRRQGCFIGRPVLVIHLGQSAALTTRARRMTSLTERRIVVGDGGSTVTTAVARSVPAAAVMVAVPAPATAVTRPSVRPIVAMSGLSDVHSATVDTTRLAESSAWIAEQRRLAYAEGSAPTE